MVAVYCADRRLYDVLPTAVHSLLLHNANIEKVYCIIEDDSLDSLQNPRIRIINMNKCDLPKCDLNTSSRYPYAAIVRCFLDLILKEDKVIYLDVDTIVTGDIQELWNTDICDNYAAAVVEYGMYFNSGVMLMNLSYMRTHNSSEEFAKFLESRTYQYPDQTAINAIFSGKIKNLPDKFNAWSILQDPYSKLFVIRHFTGIEKPWNSSYSDKRDVELWNKYYTNSI